MAHRAGIFGRELNGAALDRTTIRDLIAGEPPLVEELLSLEEQLQTNGFDLSLKEVSRFRSSGSIGKDPQQRELSDTELLAFGPDGWLYLPPGPYLVTFNEIVNLPLDLMALGLPRSSLLRSGVSLHTAVWDAGYRGRSQALVSIQNPAGFRLQQGARLMQLVFFYLARPVDQGYTGRFQGENLES